MNARLKIPLKLKLFLPVSFIIITVVIVVTIWFVNKSISSFNVHIKETLKLEVKTISKMFERENMLKLEKVQNNLKVANEIFYRFDLFPTKEKVLMEVENQQTHTKHIASLNKWIYNGYVLNENNCFVDDLQKIIGGTISIFQRIDSGFVRISTNVLRPDGKRAIGTYIPNESPVVKSVLKGERYYGRAIVVDEWYTTAYEPIIKNGEVIGMLYVGDKEKDIRELKKIINSLRIGKSGYSFVFGKDGIMLIHPYLEGQTWSDTMIFNQIKGRKSGGFEYVNKGKKKMLEFLYFPSFELYIASCIENDVENRELVYNAISGAVIVATFAILLLLGFIYRFTTERLYRYFNALQVTNQKLESAETALKQSEKLASIGQISAGIAHELNNPLGVITMYSNILLEELDKNDPKVKDLELIVEQATRCKNIVSGLLNFARKNKIKTKEIDIIKFINHTLESVVIPNNIKISVVSDLNDPFVMIDENQMMQAFTNIEKNAVEAMPNGGEINIRVEGNESNVSIHFQDTGPGIPQEHMDKLFTPFFTTKEPGKGTGLGLSQVYGVVKVHNGNIYVKSNTDKTKGKTGTEFIITLPRTI